MYLVAVFCQDVTHSKGVGKLNYNRHILIPVEKYFVLICLRFPKPYRAFQQHASIGKIGNFVSGSQPEVE